MKTLKSSDLNTVVLNNMNSTVNYYGAVRLAAPLTTSAIWGFDASAGAESAIWGTLPAQPAQASPPSSAIWGTRSFRRPMQQTALGQHSRSEWLS
ncbi:MAG TPA: hypothetical protein VME17_17450 [Bryobacteraceae bacterium]|nr:hypothetical protein [Bryobacteraceae bacterium]